MILTRRQRARSSWRGGWTAMAASATGGRAWSSPGRATTSVIPPVAVAGRCWRRTGRCVGISTFILATTRGSGRCAPRPKTGVGRAGSGREAAGPVSGAAGRAADPVERRIEAALAPGRFVSDRACVSFVGELEAVEREIAGLVEVAPGRAVALYEAFLAVVTRRPTRSTTQAAASGCLSLACAVAGSRPGRQRVRRRRRPPGCWSGWTTTLSASAIGWSGMSPRCSMQLGWRRQHARSGRAWTRSPQRG
jgi:hypothetical protein